MNTFLLDTTVASLFHPKKKNDTRRAKYEMLVRGHVLALSFQTVAELWEWAEKNEWGAESRVGLDRFIRRFLVIPYDYALAQVWARVMVASRNESRRLEAGDCWIMATAIHRRIPLLTHDADFLGRSLPDLQIISYLETSENQNA